MGYGRSRRESERGMESGGSIEGFGGLGFGWCQKQYGSREMEFSSFEYGMRRQDVY